MTPFLEPLSPEEEQYYLERYRAGDDEAKDQLTLHNMRLVAHIAKKYACPERDLEELISVGCVGLIKAVQTFRPDKGSKLGTYIARCVQNEILMLMRSERKKSRDVSLYEPIGTDKEGNPVELVDVMEAEDEDIAESCDRKDKLRWLHGSVGRVLSGREYDIIAMRYGLDGRKEKTQREVAAIFGISRSYVSRIEKKALGKLRKDYEEHGKHPEKEK